MTIKIIDPHIHLFARSIGDYHWLKSENPPFWPDKAIIQRDFDISDLNHDLTNNLANDLTNNDELTLSGFVHIEAGFDNDKPWRELKYLDDLSLDCLDSESLANKSFPPKQFRTIASIDLLASSKDFKLTLKKLKNHHSLIGVRHILDEQAYDILSSQQTQHNFASLNKIKDFIFELQLPLANSDMKKVMPLIIKTITNNSQLRFIINHAGFPPNSTSSDINSETLPSWQNNITELAQYANVFIKCSGMEMIDRQYTMSWFSIVTRFCISQFSVERVMIASNFPLCLFAQKSYEQYWQDILESSVIKQCSEKEKSALLYNNALKIYQIKTKI